MTGNQKQFTDARRERILDLWVRTPYLSSAVIAERTGASVNVVLATIKNARQRGDARAIDRSQVKAPRYA